MLIFRKKIEEVNTVSKESGWRYGKALKMMTKAKERYGIEFEPFVKYQLWKYPFEDMGKEFERIKKTKQDKFHENKEKCISHVVKSLGCDRYEAKTMITDARKRLGISYSDYRKYSFEKIPVEKQQEKYDSILETRRNISKNVQGWIKEVMDITGWDIQKTKAHINDAKRRTNCSVREYLLYRFYELDEKTQGEYCVMDFSRRATKKYTTSKELIKLLIDKSQTNEYFADFIGRKWCVNTEVSKLEFLELFRDTDRIIYKPIKGIGGHGIEAFDIDDNIEQVYDTVSAMEEGVVEEYVKQHHKLMELSPNAVNTIRVVTVSSKTKPVLPDGRMMDISYAAMRIGSGSAVVDNISSGGMVAAVDIENGKLCTHAADRTGKAFEKHPYTEVIIKGFEIPFFNEVLDFVRRANELELVAGNIGWDIAITEEGPVLIEVNYSPGTGILQCPYIEEKKGMKRIYEQYL